ALAGTDGASWPFWSPDSRQIAYMAAGSLMKINASGGPPQTLCKLFTAGTARGGTWNRDGIIVFNSGPAGLFRVATAGGQPTPITKIEAPAIGHSFPSFLPDGHHFLFFADSGFAAASMAGVIYVGSIDGGEPVRLIESDTGAVYDSASGRLLFGRRGTLYAQTFDPRRAAVSGEPVPIAEGAETGVMTGNVAFSVSENGILSYGTGEPITLGLRLTWVDRRGQTLETVGPEANYRGIDLAPD